MIIRNGKELFTEEDRQNMTIRNYTDAEIRNNLKKYAKQSRLRRGVLLAAFLISLIFAVNCSTDPYSFFSRIVVVLFAAGCLLSESLYWLNRKAAASSAYIEFIVEQKKETETDFQNSVMTGPESICHYPVFGRDTATNYGSIWYLDKEEYKNVKAGEMIRKNVANTQK